MPSALVMVAPEATVVRAEQVAAPVGPAVLEATLGNTVMVVLVAPAAQAVVA